MSTDPCTFEEEAKVGRIHTRRAWCVFVLIFIGLLGFIVSLYIVDGPAPDDSALLPHFSEGGGENNALAVFLQKIDNIEALSIVKPSLQRGMDFLDQPQEVQDKHLSDNKKILELLDELLSSSPDTWRYNLQGTLNRVEFPGWPMSYRFINALHLYDIRLAMDLRREDYSAVIARCQKLLEAANGIEGAEGLTSCWKISDAMRNLALDALTQFAVKKGSEANILQQVKDAIEEEVNNHQWHKDFMHAMQMDYLLFKETISYIKKHPSEAPLFIRINPVRISWFTQENKTSKLYLHFQQPIVQELVMGDILGVANKFTFRNQTFDSIKYDRWGSLKPNSTGLYLVESFLSDDKKYFINRVEAQAKIEVLYTMLAIRIYELKYHKLPDKLDELTPEFMLPSFKDSQNFEELRWSKEDLKIYRKNMINVAHHRDPVIKTEFDYLWESHNTR